MKRTVILSLLIVIFACSYSIEAKAGLTWNKAYSQGKPFAIYALGEAVFAATDHGLLRSTDHGATWVYKGQGIGSYAVTSMYKRGNTLFAGVYEKGVMKSDNNGDSWQMSSSGIDIKYITGFASNTNYIFATAIAFCQPDSGSVYRSADNGATWTKINKGLNNCSQLLLYGIVANDDFAHVSTEVGPFRSEDDGDNWISSQNGSGPSDCKTAFLNGDITYVADTQGTYFSFDSAKTWQQSYNNMLEFLAIKGDTIYACGNNVLDVMISTDKGSIWSPTGSMDTWGLKGIAISGGNLIVGCEHDQNFGIYVAKLPGKNADALEIINDQNQVLANYIQSEDVIRFNFPNPIGDISLSLYDMEGNLLLREDFPGSADATLDASVLGSGIYFIVIQSPGTTKFSKIAIIR